VVAEAGAYATISNEAPARGKAVGSPIALAEVEKVEAVEEAVAESDGVAVVEVEAVAAVAVPEPALISRKAIALVARAAVSHMMAKELAAAGAEEEAAAAATAAAMEAAAAEAEVEVEEECAMIFSVATAQGGLRAAFHMKKEVLVAVAEAEEAIVASAEGAEAADGVGLKIRTVLLVVPPAQLLVCATTSKKVGVPGSRVDFPTKKQHPEVGAVVVALVEVVVVAAAVKAVVVAFVSHGKRENARVGMIVALLILETDFLKFKCSFA